MSDFNSTSSTTDLPPSVSNIIDSYVSEEKYKESVTSNKLLLTELEDTNKNYMLDCKMSYALAEKYIQKNELENISPITLSGIFISLLQVYTYEEILNDRETFVLAAGFCETNTFCYLYEYIHELINSYKYLNLPRLLVNRDIQFPSNVCGLSNSQSRYYQKLFESKITEENRILIWENFDDSSHNHYIIIYQCLIKILKLNPNVYSTIAWEKYSKEINELISYPGIRLP